MYTAITQTGDINIEASSRLLDRTSMENRSYQYNMFSYYRYQYFNHLHRSILLYLAYIAHVFLTSSLI